LAGNRTLAAEIEAGTEIVPTAVDLARASRPHQAGDRSSFCSSPGWERPRSPERKRLAPAFRRLADRRKDVRFKVICDREPRPSGLPVDFEALDAGARKPSCLRADVGVMRRSPTRLGTAASAA
jgi:hypothetical protein